MVLEASAATAFTLLLSLIALAACLRTHQAVTRASRLTASAHRHFVLSHFFTLIALFSLSLSFFMGTVANDFVLFYGLQSLGLVLLALAGWRFSVALRAPAVEEADPGAIRAAHSSILSRRSLKAEKDFDKLLGMARGKALVLIEAGRGVGAVLIASYLINRLAYSVSSHYLVSLATSAHPSAFRKSFAALAPRANLWASDEKSAEEEINRLFQTAPPSNPAILRRFFETLCGVGLPTAFVGDWAIEPAERLSYDEFHELIHSLIALLAERDSVLFVAAMPGAFPGDKLGILRRYADIVIAMKKDKRGFLALARDQQTGREERLRLALEKLLIP